MTDDDRRHEQHAVSASGPLLLLLAAFAIAVLLGHACDPIPVPATETAPMLYGHLPSPAGVTLGRDVGHLVGVDPRSPDEVDLSALLPETIAQRGQSCEGASTWGSIDLACIAAGRPRLNCSYQAIYGIGRMLEDPTAEVIPDVGSYGYLILAGTQSWGLTARARWPDDVELTKPVAIDVFEAGSRAKVPKNGVFQIFEEDAETRFARIEQTVAKGLGVRCAMPVTAEYEDGPGELYAGTSGTVLGLHSQLIVGYVKRRPGRPGRYKLKNSWGPRWNGDGHVWVHEDVVAELMTELSAVTFAPPAVQ